MELMGLLFMSATLGLRHGLDADHIAAITDMVGAETKAKRSLKLGLMYALGHGMVVLLIGVLAILAGQTLPDGVLKATEVLVGASLLVLGTVMLLSLWKAKGDYRYKGRVEIIMNAVRTVFRRDASPRSLQIGLAGAMTIGVVHGIGAETPTQLSLIGHTTQAGSFLLSAGLVLMFVIGLLMSTSLISFLTAWGFKHAKSLRLLHLLMGLAAGGYSVYLGTEIILGV